METSSLARDKGGGGKGTARLLFEKHALNSPSLRGQTQLKSLLANRVETYTLHE